MTRTTAQEVANEANLARGNVDPTAGVVPWPKYELCPRCSYPKGRKSKARPGLCADCRVVLTPEERIVWRNAA